MRAAVLGFLLVGFGTTAVSALAQTPQPSGSEPPKRLFIDSVVATINDSTILQSKLLTTAAGSIRSKEAELGRALTMREMQQLITPELFDLIHRHQMAQSAKSFGQLKPEQVEQILRSELERDKQDRVRDLGGYLAFSDELGRQGRTWQTYAQEQRVDMLHRFAEQFSIYDRLHKQSNLYLTPRMLRETYEAQKHLFVRTAEAEVWMVAFSGPSADQDAKAAAEKWRLGDFTAQEIAKLFPGSQALQPLRDTSLPGPVAEFARAGPLGNVSDPITRVDGRVIDVAKIVRHFPASDGRFEDPEVQELVRRLAESRLIGEFRQQALDRAGERTEVWIYQNGRRVPLN